MNKLMVSVTLLAAMAAQPGQAGIVNGNTIALVATAVGLYFKGGQRFVKELGQPILKTVTATVKKDKETLFTDPQKFAQEDLPMYVVIAGTLYLGYEAYKWVFNKQKLNKKK